MSNIRNIDKAGLPEARISVLMPVYNGGKYIGKAIESILNQSFDAFELLIIDDASTDDTAQVVRQYTDRRIRYVRNDKNLGVAGSLNRGIDIAKCEYIARMDADDVCCTDRFRKQVEFMDRHPDVGISGGRVRYFGQNIPSVHRVPCEHTEIAAFMLFDTPMCHVTVIMRRSMMESFRLRYDPSFTRSEDYELWSRAIQCFPMTNQENVFVNVRVHGESVTKGNFAEMIRQVGVIQGRLMARLFSNASQSNLDFHVRVGRGYRLELLSEIKKAEEWLLGLKSANTGAKVFDAGAFSRVVAQIWFRCCMNSTPAGMKLFETWRNSTLAVDYSPDIALLARFILSLLWHKLTKSKA